MLGIEAAEKTENNDEIGSDDDVAGADFPLVALPLLSGNDGHRNLSALEKQNGGVSVVPSGHTVSRMVAVGLRQTLSRRDGRWLVSTTTEQLGLVRSAGYSCWLFVSDCRWIPWSERWGYEHMP